jgi:paraquat-inducible protein B
MTTDHTPQNRTDADKPAEMIRTKAPRPIWSRLSVVWMVPLVALLVTLGIAWKSYSDRGELIQIEFADATGIAPGETALKFREIQVGKVETVGFSADLTKVIVAVRVDKEVAPFIDADASFWLVRPEVSAQGISNLGTVLSGTYIEGAWDSETGEDADRFAGLDRAPIDTGRGNGTWVTLAAEDGGGLSEGAPIIFRGIPVGRIANPRLADGGTGVVVDAFIEAPHDERLTTATRFWDTSGFSLSVGPSGVNVDVRSLASLVQGGIEFSTYTAGGAPVQSGQEFRLFSSAEEAQTSIFDNNLASQVNFTLLFDEAVQGLSVGTPVQFRGVEAGEVSDISVRVANTEDGEQVVRQQIVIAIAPGRLGMWEGSDAESVAEFLSVEVDDGLRARIAGTGLLGQNIIIELIDIENALPEKLDLTAMPYPTIPVGPPTNTDLSASAEGLFTRVNNLPIEELLESAIKMMDSVSGVAGNPNTMEIPTELSGLLAELRTTVAELNEGNAGEKTVTAIEALTTAANETVEAFDGLPAMVTEMEKVAANAAEIPLKDIGAQIDGLLGDIRRLIGSEDAEKLPRALADTLNEAAVLLRELREGGAAENLNSALASAGDAADAVAQGTDRLPEISARLETLINRADGLVASYGERSAFNATLLDAMRELKRATASFGALARTIERNPRAFILGR